MDFKNLIKKALAEDIGKKDYTTHFLDETNASVKAKVIAKERGILAGIEVFKKVFKTYDRTIKFSSSLKDGQEFKKGTVICELAGKASSILSCERTALNFLQRLSGIATLTNKFVKKVKGTKVKILDTRKTTPLLRRLEKYAVRVGGGKNHRFSLSTGIMIKDNHKRVVGSLEKAILQIKKRNRKKLPLIVEVENLKEFKIAQELGVKWIMLDNFRLEDIKKAVKKRKSDVRLEVSGEVTLSNVSAIAKTGVDYISIGALTHSPKTISLSLEIFRNFR